jgi:hypothetical protein
VVLAAVQPRSEPVIVAVLSRDAGAIATLSVPDAGGLRVTAPEIALAASGELATEAQSITVNAQVGRFTINATHFFGDAAFVVINAFEALYEKLQCYADKLITKAGYSLRLVDELDSTVASTMLVQAKQTYSLQSTQTILTSTQDTRIDGERISMG